MEPVISVILPTYNGPKYIAEAVESILAQTFGDLELIIIDDGSTDETPDVVRRYTDRRIRLYTQPNMGLAGTLNRGIALASGKYIARQDQDDRSLPDRLRKQVAYLDDNPDCALVGTWAEIWIESTRTDRMHAHPASSPELKVFLLTNNPFVHSSVVLRKVALERVGVYSVDRGRQPPEDYELWSRVARSYDVANIPEALHVYREVQGSMSRSGPSPFLDRLVTITAENIAWAADISPADAHVINLAALEHGARHRMHGEPDFAAMREIFGRAAARAAGSESARFTQGAEQHVKGLEDRWCDSYFPRRWQRRLLGGRRRVSRTP